MPTSISCVYKQNTINVNKAKSIKKKDKHAVFYCVNCGETVNPHKSGGHTEAHFEHEHRNSECPLSHNSKTYKYTNKKKKSIESRHHNSDRRVFKRTENAFTFPQCFDSIESKETRQFQMPGMWSVN